MQSKIAIFASLLACALFFAAMFAPRAAQPPTASEANRSPTKAQTFRTEINDEPNNPKIIVELRRIPNIKLRPRPATMPEEASEIKRLIAAIVNFDDPNRSFYISMPCTRGQAFAPLDEPNAKASPELKRLIELGPQALPFLLAALDDQTPTRSTVTANAKFFANELSLSANPNNPFESRILSARRNWLAPASQYEHIDIYNIKVGDMCFDAIGQIVGRSYGPVRYQPTFCFAINSPTHDPNLCRQVRDIWSSANPRQMLFNSLLLDYATGAVVDGKEDFDVASGLQCHAAMRLLYYFPEESTAMIAERIDHFQVDRKRSEGKYFDAVWEAWWQEQVANGVIVDDFVKAVAWSTEPAVKQAYLRLFHCAADPRTVLMSIPSVAQDHPQLVRRWAKHALETLHDTVNFRLTDVLAALAKHVGDGAKEDFQAYLNSNSVERCVRVCGALEESRNHWGVDLLAPLLTDRRDTGNLDYRSQDGKPRTLRVCDEAAASLSTIDPKFKFVHEGGYEDLDRQIEVMRRQIDSKRK